MNDVGVIRLEHVDITLPEERGMEMLFAPYA